MSNRALRAALTLIVAVNFGAPALAATTDSSKSEGDKASQIAAFSKEAYEKMLSASVEDEHSIKLEQGNTMRVEVAAEEKVLFFTRPGHPAHPAVVEVKIVEHGGHPGLDTIGWWAGDTEAYMNWYHAFKRRNERLSQQWQEESGPF